VTPPLPVVRPFSFARDYERVLKLWQGIVAGMHVGPSDAPEEIHKKLRRDPGLFLVAETNDDIIGTVIGGFDGRRGMIYHLAVHKRFRRQGVGGILLAEVEKRLQAMGCLKCYLLVNAGNAEAIRFYRHHGWREQEEDIVFSKEFQ
jgi:ribosomal protein S18 acetylase RimI-like enzyme